MAQILIRYVEDEVMNRLRKRAEELGRSLEAEVRLLLTDAVRADGATLREVRAKFGGETFTDSTELIREDRER